MLQHKYDNNGTEIIMVYVCKVGVDVHETEISFHNSVKNCNSIEYIKHRFCTK